MSVTRTYQPKIVVPEPQLKQCHGNILGTPSMAIMRLALQKVATEHGGALCSGYKDCRGKLHETVIGISTPRLPNGLGIDVDAQDGSVVFRYDRKDAAPEEAEQLCRDISRAYAVTAIMEAQKRLGYQVRVLEERKDETGRKVTTLAQKN